MEKKIIEFIEKIMAEASMKPIPRFSLSKSTGGQQYLDLMKLKKDLRRELGREPTAKEVETSAKSIDEAMK